jgi:hypothetical protein
MITRICAGLIGTLMMALVSVLCLSGFSLAASPDNTKLPGAYFRLLEAGAAQVEARLNAEPSATLETLEALPGWSHFPYCILASAVLYSKKHSANPRYHDPKMLALTLRIGDFLADESEKGRYEPRLDSDWDTYMWLEAYRLLDPELGEERKVRWRREIEKIVIPLVPDTIKRLDFPWYNSPYIGTSPNHYAQWASLLLLAGHVFGNDDWVKLGSRVLHRFAAEEQTPDGYWGEHSRAGPTTGYDYVTSTQVALYWEYTHDPAALQALRRSTDFHKYFTYPDGTPVEVINDRNRYWGVDAWGHFGFSNFPDGRRYAEFLTSFFHADNLTRMDPQWEHWGLTLDALGRLAQSALYYHEGRTEPIPQDQATYSYQMSIPAGIRKTGPWVVALSGVINTQSLSQFYLDRQSSVSVFHEKYGLIISGANSKRQPELATFSEKIEGQIFHLPLSSRLQMNDREDRLSLSYQTFFSDLYVPGPSEKELRLRFVLTGRGTPAEETKLNVQLCLKAGEILETGAGKRIVLGTERVELSPEDLRGEIRHHGWTLKVDPTARLVWPMYPFNPYMNKPETKLDHAVGLLSVPLQAKRTKEDWFVRPGEQEILFTLMGD